MWLFTDISMRRASYWFVPLVVLLYVPSSLGQQIADPIPQPAVSEYEAVLDQVLPCPKATLRESRDYQLCLLIVPPGHRGDDRELLMVLSNHNGLIEMALTQPQRPLWRYLSDTTTRGSADGGFLHTLELKTFRTAEAKMIARVAGRSWPTLVTQLIPPRDWFMDATSYRLEGVALNGKVEIELQGPGSSAKRQPSSILSWLERVRKEATVILQTQNAVPYDRAVR